MSNEFKVLKDNDNKEEKVMISIELDIIDSKLGQR